MKFLWNLIKGAFKTFVLWLVGIVALMLIQTNLFPEPSDGQKALIASLIIVYMIVVLVYVVKTSLSRRKKEATKPADVEADAEYREFESEIAEVETTPLPKEALEQEAGEVEEHGIVEDDSEQRGEEIERDFDALISHLEKEEKFILMVGLLALYGDGELSPKEIFQLKKTIKDLNFKPPSLTHRDPSDQALCLDETLAWSLNLIRADFADTAYLSNEDMNKMFGALTTSIELDIKAAFPDAREQREYSNRLKAALTGIANADGKLSENEKELINTYVSTSDIQLSAKQTVVGLAILGAIGFGAYKLILAMF